MRKPRITISFNLREIIMLRHDRPDNELMQKLMRAEMKLVEAWTFSHIHTAPHLTDLSAWFLVGPPLPAPAPITPPLTQENLDALVEHISSVVTNWTTRP